MTRAFSLPDAAPPAPAQGRPAHTDRRTARAGAVAAGTIGLLATSVIVLAVFRSGASARTAAADGGSTSTPVESVLPPCPGPLVDAPAGAVLVLGDLDGAGCTTGVLWWPDRAEVELANGTGTRPRFALGRPGDQLVLGDWDGDGRDTPALYDPIEGTVIRFDGWARSDESLPGTLVRTDAPTGAIARLVRIGDGPDQLDIEPAPP